MFSLFNWHILLVLNGFIYSEQYSWNVAMSGVSNDSQNHLSGLTNSEILQDHDMSLHGELMKDQGVYYLTGEQSNVWIWQNISDDGTVSNVSTTDDNTTTVSLTLSNSSWDAQLSLYEKRNFTWVYRIQSTDLLISNAAYSPREPWNMNLEIENETGKIFSRRYSLIHTSSVPVVNWNLSAEIIDQTSQDAANLKVLSAATHPCNNLAFLITVHDADKGEIYLGLNSRMLNSTKWYNLTSTVQSELDTPVGDRNRISTIMTNNYILLLTSGGLLRSNDLRVPSGDNLVKWSRILDLRHFSHPKTARLIYNPECLWRQHDTKINDLVILSRTFEDEDGELMTISYQSSDAYIKWTRLKMFGSSYIFNSHMYIMATLELIETNAEVHVYLFDEVQGVQDQKLVPPFAFPSTANISSIVMTSPSQLIYALGNQVWLSQDGGNRFEEIYTFTGDSATQMIFSKNTLVVVTENGHLYFGKISIPRLVELTNHRLDDLSWVYFDQKEHLHTAHLILQSSFYIQSARIDVETAIKNNRRDTDRPLLIEIKSSQEVFFFEYIYTGGGTANVSELETPFFEKQHHGLLLKLSDGQEGIVNDIDHPSNLASGFLSRISVPMTEPFPLVPRQSVPGSFDNELHSYTLSVELYNFTAGLARLWLKDSSGAVVDKWTSAEVGQTAVIPSSCSYLILSKETDLSAIGQSAVLANEVISRKPGTWLLVDISENSKWHLQEPECSRPIVTENSPLHQYYELDIEDTITLSLNISTRGSVLQKNLPNMYATLTNPWALSFRPNLKKDRVNYLETLSIKFTAINFHTGKTAVRIHKTHASLLCPQPLVIFVLYVGCPCTKRLVSLYPRTLLPDVFLGLSTNEKTEGQIVTLDTNYRPPSNLGVDIPTSQLIYNSDPSQPRSKDRYTVSKKSGEYGTCEGKSNRENCGCTDEMKLVYLPEYSDCVERVYMLPHPGHLQLRLYFEQLGKPSVRIEDEYVITINELNGRLPLITDRTVSEFLRLLRNSSEIPEAKFFYGATATEINMNGSGIYHIEIKLAPKQSFCSLSSYMLVYVGQTPIAYPLNYITNYTTTVLLGWLLLALYIRFLLKYHKHRVRKSGSRCRESPMVNEEGKHHHLVN